MTLDVLKQSQTTGYYMGDISAHKQPSRKLFQRQNI